jgi:hypothetical protein
MAASPLMPAVVATRYDKLAANCPAFIQLASIKLWLRVDESTSQQLHALFSGSFTFGNV